MSDPGVMRMAVRCVSGEHAWIDAADAARCCNGWHRAVEWRDGRYGREPVEVWVRDEAEAPPPARALPELAPGERWRLTIELVPTPLHYRTLAGGLMPLPAWTRLANRVKAEHGYRCAYCGAEGRLLCHEVWHYDDERHIQTLVGFKPICMWCNRVKHMGLTNIRASEGEIDLEQVDEHFMRVNECDRAAYETYRRQAFDEWERRSAFPDWTQDFGIYATEVP